MGRAEASWTQGEAGGRQEASRAAFRRRLEEKPPPGSRRKSPRRSARRTPLDAPQVRPAVSVRRGMPPSDHRRSFSRRPSRKCASGIFSAAAQSALPPKSCPQVSSDKAFQSVASSRVGTGRADSPATSDNFLRVHQPARFDFRSRTSGAGWSRTRAKERRRKRAWNVLKGVLRFFPVSNAFIGSPNRHARLA
jgi:hypothetical protein